MPNDSLATKIKENPFPVSIGEVLSLRERAEMRETFHGSVQRARRGLLPLRVPIPRKRMQRHRGMHYHFKPEIFLQMSGNTEFTTPNEKVLVRAGEICVIPAGVPHGELAESTSGSRFRNLVIGFYSRTLSLHFGFEIEPGKPEIESIEFFDAPEIDTYTMLATQLVTTYHSRQAAREHVLNGLLTSLLGLLLNLVDTGSGSLQHEIDKVFQTKWLVREELSNPDLNVKGLAEKLHCSADYLSHLFHQETGEKLIHYIQRMRIEGACLALQSTRQTISEIAWSSGFQDPAYFTRVFKRFTGHSPNNFRQHLEEVRAKRENRPKTIYFDREDFSPGQPAELKI